MHNHRLVSIVTPIRNAMPFLDEAVASVRSQTYPHWELLLVDDGSTDGSYEIARQYAAETPERIHYLAHAGHRNLGTSASRNLGIQHARGGYIALLDADDVWLPAHLARRVELLERHPEVGFAYGATEEWYSWTGRPEDRHRDTVPELRVELGRLLAPPGPLAAFVLRDAPTPCTCSFVARRAVIDAVGGFEASFGGMYDDQVLYAKLCLTTPVLAVNDQLSRYRRHPDSCYSTAKATGRAVADRLVFLEWLEGYLAIRGVSDADVWRAVRRELRPYRHPRLHRLLARLRRLAAS
jgi:glycosyltransferase involved in cell wall biosynthesis